MPNYWARGSDVPPPPPGQPPPPPPMPPPPYVFNAAASPTPTARHTGGHRPEFTFRNSDGRAPAFPAQGQMPSPTPPHRANGQPRHARRRAREERRSDAYGARGRGGSSRGRVRGAHERPLMMKRKEVTPERFAGMGEGQDGKFIALDDLSDSDEQDMEFDSPSDRESTSGLQAKSDELEENEQTTPGVGEPPRKKHARTANGVQQASNTNLPKWSNPDPYTVLPPTEETQKKKKDVVKLIRKARVSSKKEEMNNSIVGNDDFISFNFEDDEEEQSGSESSHSRSDSGVVAGAPTGPRSSHVGRFSHREHFRQHAQASAPGSAGDMLTSSSLPPPPNSTASHLLPTRPILPTQFSSDQSIPLQPRNPSIPESLVDAWPPPDTAAALGSRKRTYDDRIKAESSQGFDKDRSKSSLPDGTVVPKWAPIPFSDPTPWCGEIDHSRTENLGFWLHKEICDFYEYIRPQNFEQTVRTELVEELRNIARSKWPDSDILSFGSFAAGLYLPDSDMDLVMVSNSYMRDRRSRFHTKSHLHSFGHFIQERHIPVPGSVEVVAKAKVPLVKYVDRRTGLKVDVSFENDSGLYAIQTFHSWKATFPAMPAIVSLIKHFLAMRGLNEVYTGGLGGFSVTCLVVSLLQNMPQVASGNLTAEHHLGEVLMEFLDLYGNLLNISTTAVRVDQPGYVEKRTLPNAPYQSLEKQYRLSIIDPHNPDNDLTAGSRNIDTIRRCFSRAYDTIQRQMATLRKLDFKKRKGQSLLGDLFAGNYRNFDGQRERLRAIFMRRDNRSPTPGLQNSGLALEDESKGNCPPPQVVSQSIPRKPSSKKAGADGATGSGTKRNLKKKSKSEEREHMAARNRSIEFKRQFPEIEGVPTELSKKVRRQILKRWKSKTDVSTEGKQEKRKSTAKHATTNTTLDWNELKAKALSTAGDIVLVPRIDRFPDKVKVRRGRVTGPLAGATRSDPIEVD
ncbi:hypothetical protein GP486_005890 [Trichoglossum hirsutum]|uniref:polynucleotide adenylyltransferase n=1 Tax=Trichoglossum hirsutum TaxID=265104 RepID=A0A9P8L8D6_9PEZI|nr:hypothetical protein GP486_005890 [Trichoglossum hirsutum]